MSDNAHNSVNGSLFLKKVEIYGFKSFPERSCFVFEPGITAIVGPNGCGKTNIVDAVRWVLGEQSAYALRGTRMEDVIFNGTETIKPLGMCEISITFVNEEGRLPIDYSEVLVTRRLFRSGDSEYLINKNPCRLKDVADLFMDTGVGTNTYSFIEQGKVDMVLSSRPEDRRYLFEEAAGIGRYKSRKKESERKLEAAEQNLVRINDIIAEVQRQINSLKRQVAKAKRYKNLSEELKRLETSNAIHEFKQIDLELRASADKFSAVKKEVERAASAVASLEEELRSRRRALGEKESASSGAAEKSGEINERIINARNQKVLYEDRIAALRRGADAASAEKEELGRKLQGLREEISGFDERTVSLRQDILEGERGIKQREETLVSLSRKRKELEKKAEAIKAKVVDAASSEARFRSSAAGVESAFGNYELRGKRLALELENLNSEKAESGSNISRRREELDALKTELDRKQGEILSLEKKSAAANREISSLREDVLKTRDELNAQNASLKLAEEMRQTYRGYQGGARAVMEMKAGLDGIFSVVGELIEAPGRLRRAVEAALGEAVHYIAARGVKDAIEAFAALKEKKAGRAGFLIMELIGEVPPPPEAPLEEKGVIGRISGSVKFKEGFRGLGEMLLGRTLLVEDAETAGRVFKTLPEGWKAVTLDGEVFDSRGFLSGGHVYSRGPGLVDRASVVSESRESVKALSGKLESMLEKEKGLLEESAKLSEKENELRESAQDARGEFKIAENAYSEAVKRGGKLAEDIALLEDEIKSLEQDKAIAEKEISAAAGQLEAASGEKSRLEAELASVQEEFESLAVRREEILSELTDLKVSIAQLKEKEESSRSHFILKKQSSAEYEEQMEKRGLNISESLEKITDYSGRIRELEEELSGLGEKKEECAKISGELAKECEALAFEIREREGALDAGRSELSQKQDRMHKLDIRNSELRMQINALKDRMYSNYKVNIDDVDAGDEAAPDEIQGINDEIVRLQARLEAMGAVNLIAIEEHRDLEERHQYLCSQRDDLLEARDTLQKAIQRINQTARSMFMETFREINEKFGELFVSLFQGGRAELILVDERNVLESGIEIIARPPGKKLQNISLLSGGEKAMTAIALLFAIMKVRPSPFCILDEIDASLDDANIGRFVELVREFSGKSQFMIVTHNKATIAAANAIYGITMEQKGVSKPISIRFSERNREDGIDEIEGVPLQ